MDRVKGSVVDSGVASWTPPGCTESGDLHFVFEYPNGILVGVVDGLGHGKEAAAAAELAAHTLEKQAPDSLPSLVRHMKVCVEREVW